MTCYFRQMSAIFAKAGIEVTQDNKRQIDQVIHKIVGVSYKNCSATWKEVKKKLAEDEGAFITTLKNYAPPKK